MFSAEEADSTQVPFASLVVPRLAAPCWPCYAVVEVIARHSPPAPGRSARGEDTAGPATSLSAELAERRVGLRLAGRVV